MRSILKLSKKIILFMLIIVFPIQSFAAVSVSDGSAFVSKSEFSASLNNMSNRISIIENTLDAKIDSLVSSYLSRNGIWNADKQFTTVPSMSSTFTDSNSINYAHGFLFACTTANDSAGTSARGRWSNGVGSSGKNRGTLYRRMMNSFYDSSYTVTKSGLMFVDYKQIEHLYLLILCWDDEDRTRLIDAPENDAWVKDAYLGFYLWNSTSTNYTQDLMYTDSATGYSLPNNNYQVGKVSTGTYGFSQNHGANINSSNLSTGAATYWMGHAHNYRLAYMNGSISFFCSKGQRFLISFETTCQSATNWAGSYIYYSEIYSTSTGKYNFQFPGINVY